MGVQIGLINCRQENKQHRNGQNQRQDDTTKHTAQNQSTTIAQHTKTSLLIRTSFVSSATPCSFSGSILVKEVSMCLPHKSQYLQGWHTTVGLRSRRFQAQLNDKQSATYPFANSCSAFDNRVEKTSWSPPSSHITNRSICKTQNIFSGTFKALLVISHLF
jgi:hypothetical protein